jgi:hypothetical protein
MSRIFFSLGILALLLMAATLSIGLYLGDLKAQLLERRQVDREIQTLQTQLPKPADWEAQLAAARARLAVLDAVRGWFRVHLLLGVGTSLTVILVNCMAVTYFIGTGRWCREVVETYQLDPTLAAKSQMLKRRSFPWAALGIVSALVISAMGAAADPGTLRSSTDFWATPHMVAAFAGLLMIAWAFFIQWANIGENHAVIQEIVARVGEVRRERGLEM